MQADRYVHRKNKIKKISKLTDYVHTYEDLEKSFAKLTIKNDIAKGLWNSLVP